MQGQLNRNMAQNVGSLNRNMAQMNSDLALMRTQLHSDAQMRSQAATEAREQAMQVQNGGSSRMSMGYSGCGGSGISTMVVNGDVYVNGERVASVPHGSPVSLQTTGGVVQLNGDVVWSSGDATSPVSTPTVDNRPSPARSLLSDRGGRHADVCARALEGAMRGSRPDVCREDRGALCSVCLDEIVEGNNIRTLPCFHVLHRKCAEDYFRQSAAALQRNGNNRTNRTMDVTAVLCPVCRSEVST